MGAEQSNSSLVLDERYALKLYRRIAPGMNPELEVLRFLTERGFEHTAALEGYIAYEGRPLEATLATVQEFVPAKGDGWELALDSLEARRARLAPGARTPARRGDGAACTTRSRPIRPIRTSRPRIRAPRRSGSCRPRSTRRSSTSSPPCPRSPALEQVRGRGEEVRDHLRLLTNIGHVGRVIRTHGDYHLGQALWTSEGDWLILDFEGEPARSVPERRRKTSPLRDVAGMLRSFAYAASAAKIRRGVDPPEGWEERCRTRVPGRLPRDRRSGAPAVRAATRSSGC